MIHWIKGAKIGKCDDINEGYKVEDECLSSVLNAENIMKVFDSFVEAYRNHNFFLFLEVPCTADEEEPLHSQDGKTHRNIYYLDNIGVDTVLELLHLFKDYFVEDGLIAFGLGNHESEIGKYKYNTVIAYSSNIDLMREIFEGNHIPENNALLSPWDIISQENPGQSQSYESEDGRTIYDVVEALTSAGLYKAETRAD